MDIYNAIFAH